MKTKILIMSALTAANMMFAGNPLLEPYKTPHETIPFHLLKNEHYLPAFQEAMKQHNAEIDLIVNNSSAPTFENTIVALEKSGSLLNRVSSPFFNMMSAETNDELQNIAQEISPLLTEHANAITLNDKLFQRVKKVYDAKDRLLLNPEQSMLLQKTYDNFVENGANLSESDKKQYRELSKELNLLNLQFGQNVLKETNKWNLLIKDKNILAGLPADVLDMLAMNAKKGGNEGWQLDLKATTYVPVMKYADNRDLRRELYMAYATRNILGGEYDNQDIIRKIVNTRLKIANLLGYKSYADYVLVRRMAEKKENVYDLMNKLLKAYRPQAEKEFAEVQAYANKNGAYFKLQSWDWSYYSEKLKAEKFDLNDEMLKPYFELENVKHHWLDLDIL